MSAPAPHILVIGGGSGGLATAYRLRRRLPQARITIIEAKRWGGVTGTSVRDGFVLEHGPDSIIRVKPAGMRLIADLGLTDQVQSTAPAARHGLIARGNRLIPIPEGLYLMAPGKIAPFLRSPLLSWPGKLRMACDLVLPRRGEFARDDESLGRFVRRRLGREALERIAQPLVGGIYTADPEELSVAATMPQFLEMEQTHGSLILAMMERSRQAALAAGGTTGGKVGGQSGGENSASGPRYGLFASLNGGLQRLVDRLVEVLSRDCDLRLGVRATHLHRGDHGGWTVGTNNGSIDADAVALALPAHAAAELLTPADPALAELLTTIPYASVATVNLAFSAADAPGVPQAAGFVVPEVEHRSVLACTIASAKYADRAPPGTVLLRAFVGGARHEDALNVDDDSLVHSCLTDLRRWFTLGEPRFTVVHRWPKAMAQYTVAGGGHLARVARIRAREAALSGFALVGNGYEGVGIPDLAAQGEAAAERIARSWSA